MISILSHIRAYLLVIFIVVHTLISSLFVITCLVLHLPRRFADFFIGPYWCGGIVKFSGIKPVLKGIENVPQDRGFLYLFTHSSHMDVPILFYTSPKSFRFGAKSSLFKIPVFGYAVRLSGTLPITREDRSKVMKVYQEAEQRVARGEAFALAPEGGRRTVDDILEFKSGPFIFAINAKMPVVPVVICGADRVLPKKSILINKDRWSRQVGVHFLPAVETEDIALEDMKALKAKVREDIKAEFEKMKPLYLK